MATATNLPNPRKDRVESDDNAPNNRAEATSDSSSGVMRRLLTSTPERQLSGFEAAAIVERGLPTDSVDALREWGLTFREVHDLVLPARTLKHRVDKGQRLSSDETDRILRIAKVLALADHVFGAHDRGIGWLRQPTWRLEDRPPLKLLRSEAGAGMVTEMLYQLDEGMVI